MNGKKINRSKSKDLESVLKIQEGIPTFALIESLNFTIEVLARRGVKIKDWDDKARTVYKFKWLGGKAYILIPKTGASEKTVNGDD